MVSDSKLCAILEYAIANWRERFVGTSGLDISGRLSIPHEEVVAALETLNDQGKGSLNRDVKLYPLAFQRSEGMVSGEPVVTHVFFPSKSALKEDVERSGTAGPILPEYLRRLHLGAGQIELAFFSAEVLSKYLRHPEKYELDDSLSGGHITTRDGVPDDDYFFLRYGRCQQFNGDVTVTAIYKDLAELLESEQHYWRSFEVLDPDIRPDEDFKRFLNRTYEGSWDDFPDPIAEVYAAIAEMNESLGSQGPYRVRENVHLHAPAESTYKALCDSAGELYKVIGPDALDTSQIRSVLINRLAVSESELVHAESGRPLSSMQMLKLMESVLGLEAPLTLAIRAVGELRTESAHRILSRDKAGQEYHKLFAEICRDVSAGLKNITEALRSRRQSGVSDDDGDASGRE